MKRLLNVAALTLALNFVLAAGGVGYLAATGHLTRARVADVRRVLFPPPATQPTAATQPATPTPVADVDPVDRLGALAARTAALPPGERLEAVQQQKDVEAAELDRRRREVQDVRHQVELAQGQVSFDRDTISKARQSFADQQKQQSTAAADKGFQDSLELYRTLPAKQVKAIFTTLPDDTVQQYLQAMDARQAGKIMKEFKSPDDVVRLERVLEKIRQARAAAAATPADPTATAAVPDGR